MNIAIAGYGVEGKASYDYWKRDGNTITIVDERSVVNGLPASATTILGEDAFTKLDNFDLIIRSPGINPKKLPYGDKVWSATNEFFEKCPAPIIGVTGTKGKGTTCSLIFSILKAADKTVHLVGNIGTPALAELPKIKPDDIVVYELSSFQLWDAKKSPHIAVVLMIEPDHLDVHDDMNDYVQAKANIIRHQAPNDFTVFNRDNSLSTKIASYSKAKKIEYPFELGNLADDMKLPGAHNRENANAAVAAVSEYVTDEATIRRGLGDFSGLPHRLKFVRNVNGVDYYDDSIATTPGSVIAAVRSFPDRHKILILGGSDKGADYSELISFLRTQDVEIIAIGQIGDKIASLCDSGNVICQQVGIDATMSDIVRTTQNAKPGDIVILSPAAASFDMFKNYSDRGNQFVAAVNAL